MLIHIVCSFAETDRILPRLAQLLAKGTGWSISGAADPDADLNYYFPYLEVRKSTVLSGRSAGLFTHNETLVPGKVKIWESAAQLVDLRVTWATQYEEQLQQYGETVRILPPLDRDAFTIGRSRGEHAPLIAGVSGYVYSGGRKGEELIAEVLKTDIGTSFDWRAIGRGWPRPLQTNTIPNGSLPAFYQTLDLYVCPSLIEGIPYGPLEALACGIPVVIPRGVGLLDELGDVRGIIRYEAGNVEAFADALEVAHENIYGAHDFDPEELRAVTERFSLDAWVSGHLAAFTDVEARETAARASDSGIYVVAFGEPARDCAERLIASVRTHMPDTPVAVASERPVPGADIYVAAPDEDLGGRAAKTHMWSYAPPEWKRVLYLDADTELIAPINFLFDALNDGWEMVCTKDVKNYEMISELWRRDSEEQRRGMEAIGSNRALQLAGGVIGFRRTPAVEQFLKGWYDEWKIMARRDQGALVRSLYAYPVRLLVLGNHWNAFTDGISPEEPAGIIHHRGGPARRVGGWSAGRMDSPEAFAGVHEVAVQRNGLRGVEGVIRSGERRFHRGASVTITNSGPKTTRRQGRTGRTYIFPPRIPVTVTGEDAPHVARSGEPDWEVGDLECPVCHAPNGACIGDEIAAKESNMEKNKQPMRMVRQDVDPNRGVAGYVGEEEGLVETHERQPRFADNGVTPSLKDKLAAMSDEELKELGVVRPEADVPELHDFVPNRGGVNCLTCRRNEANGDHFEKAAEDTDEKPLVAAPASAKRHRPARK